MHIKISISTYTPEASDNMIDFYNSYDLIRDLGIDYIFLNRARAKEYDRFLTATEHFTVVFQNEAIAIFKVAQNERIFP